MKIYKNNNAFTLIELVFSMVISVIVLVIIFSFVSNAIYAISLSNRETKFLNNFGNFRLKFDNYKNIYPVNNIFGTGNNVVFLESTNGDAGVLIGVVNYDTLKLNPDNTMYSNNVLGFRELSLNEVSAIKFDYTQSYDLSFTNDKLFSDIKVKKYEVTSFNSGEILDINMEINLNFNNSFLGKSWQNIYIDSILQLNTVF